MLQPTLCTTWYLQTSRPIAHHFLIFKLVLCDGSLASVLNVDFCFCSIWNYESGVRMNYFDNGNPKTSRITSIDILNAHDLSLLLTASGKVFGNDISTLLKPTSKFSLQK